MKTFTPCQGKTACRDNGETCLVCGRGLGPVNTNFIPATRPIRDAAREARRAAMPATANGSRQRDAPESARPEGLLRESASAALRRLIDALAELAISREYENIGEFTAYVADKVEKKVRHRRAGQG